jgi:hypothetical protein
MVKSEDFTQLVVGRELVKLIRISVQALCSTTR